MKDIKTIEVTKENEDRYLQKISDLEEVVLSNMEKQGKIGQLFITGKQDISEYVHSDDNTVMVAVDDKDSVIAATYITQGQKEFTYNDITKYFKISPEYEKYIKSQYPNEMSYKKDVLEAYEIKMKAYKYAREKVLQEFLDYSNIREFLKSELASEGQFDEKSVLREKLISYMSEYIDNREATEQKGALKQYERFFWMTAEDVAKIIHGEDAANRILNSDIIESEDILQLEQEHQQILENSRLKIHEEPEFEQQKYFEANPQNSIEIDTYITDPNNRSYGLARELVFEGIKTQLLKAEESIDSEDIFLCSTLHRDNLSSKYVSEFFGLRDSLFVNRRKGRDREVHITRIKSKDIKGYLKDIQEKLAVLYGYKRETVPVSTERKQEIIKEQIQYEKAEFKRLNKIRHSTSRYKGIVKNMESKVDKIERLKKKMSVLSSKKMDEIDGDEER